MIQAETSADTASAQPGPADSLSRDAMIAKLMWNSGGAGFGACAIAGAGLWSMDRPGSDKPDLISIVAVNGSPEKYSDEELAKLVAFSELVTARYDKLFGYRRGANLIVFGKMSDGTWLRKRLTWDVGRMFSLTLDDAIEVMSPR